MDQARDTGEGFTKLMYDMATAPSLTHVQAVEQLRRDAHLRTISETLSRYAHIPVNDIKALQSFLIEKLLAHSPPGTKYDTISRKVRMWLGGDVQSISKQGAIQLSFALELAPEEAGKFLHRTCGEGFHWRDPEELIFLYALRESMPYPQALVLRDSMAKKNLLSSGSGNTEIFTDLVRRDAEQITSIEELEDYLRQSQGQLGSFHNTAYALFREYLDLLCAPEINDLLDPDKKISVREVTATCLHTSLIPRFKKATKETPAAEKYILSALQRDIQQNWPDEISLSRMLHRKTDVSRKALILLFLATDGASSSDALCDDDDLPEEDEDFEGRYTRLNTMLCDCGFAPLDSRSPFDWMIIYCMCIEDSMFIDTEVEAFLNVIFSQPPSSEPAEA